MTVSNFKQFKLTRMREVMRVHGLDVLIASSPANIQYMFDYSSIVQKISRKVGVFCVFNAKTAGISIIIPSVELPTLSTLLEEHFAKEHLGDIRIYTYGAFYFAGETSSCNKVYASPAAALIQALKDINVSNCNLGWDEYWVTPQLWNEVTHFFTGVNFILAANVFTSIRLVKHAQEINALKNAVKITEQALAEVINKLRIGLTETEIYRMYSEEIIRNGGDLTFCVATIDKRSAFADTPPTNAAITSGSVLRLDIGCSYAGYNADIARTIIVGQCSAKVRDYYEAILAGEQAVIKNICPGISAENLFNLAVAEVRKVIPHYKRHHCGHGIGLSVHEAPLVAPDSTEQLQANMTLCIETPYYELGWGGIQVEDMLLITQDGSEYLSTFDRNLIYVVG